VYLCPPNPVFWYARHNNNFGHTIHGISYKLNFVRTFDSLVHLLIQNTILNLFCSIGLSNTRPTRQLKRGTSRQNNSKRNNCIMLKYHNCLSIFPASSSCIRPPTMATVGLWVLKTLSHRAPDQKAVRT